MNSTTTKVGAYLVGLAVVFAAALGVGSAVGPVGPADDRTESPAHDVNHDGMDTDGDGGS
jgi:hypothetical protein